MKNLINLLSGFLLQFFSKKTKFACNDAPDPKDWIAGLPKGNIKLPKSVNLLAKAYRLGWKVIKQSRNSCTAFSRGNLSMITNTISHQAVAKFDCEKLWQQQLKTGANVNWGDTLQNSLEQYRKYPQGFPDSPYKRITPSHDSLEQQRFICKAWITRGNILYTGIYWRQLEGSYKSNYQVMLSTGFYQRGSGKPTGGHCIIITGYDDTKRCPDGSIGAFLGLEPELMPYVGCERGEFFIPYTEANSLMSIYVPIDKRDKEFE